MAGGRFVQRELRERVLPRPRVFVDRTNPLETLNEDEVFRRFRFRPRTVIFIVGLIENVVTHRTKRSLALPPLLQVLVTLRFLATGAFQQLIGDSLNRISQPTISRIVRRVTRALTSLVKDFIKFPTGRAATTVKQEFGSIAGFPNVLGCVDGTFIRIKRPTQNEADFLNRKGYHSLNVQAICDAHMRITSFNASWPGSVHDSRIWNSSALKDQFENGVHDGLLLGDSGYACRRYMMTPYLHPADRSQERFNSSLCRTRVRVEQTFGVLKARFPCLRFGLRMAPECAVTVTSACIILHNIGILRSDILDVEIDNNNQLHIQDQGVLAQPDGKHVSEMAKELTQTHKSQLSKWIGSSKSHKFTLLYKISRDGCDAQTFHTYCDNKGPTVTVLYNTNNSVYGGYTAASWNYNGAYIPDPKAFLFKLEYNGARQPMKFPNKTNGTNAIYGASGYGPTFGGHDLHSFTNSINKSGNYFPLNGNTNGLDGTYDFQGQNYNSVMNGHLQVLDLEVYRVEEVEILQKPWIHNVDWSSKLEEELKDKVATYKPLPGLDLQQARILLVGQVGAGKSSYFNTINSIFRGHISAQANTGSAEHSLTTAYRIYQVRDGYAGKALNFRLCDTRGLEEDQGLDDRDVDYLLDGHVPDRYKFNPSVSLSPDAIGYVKHPKLSDKIHCVVFVLDGSTVDVLSEKVLERIKSMQIRMNQRGIPQVVLLTKIDRICEEISDDVSKVFFSLAMKECVEKVAMVMGLPRSHVLPVKNYESEVELDQNTNILALLSLRRLLYFVDDFLYNKLDEMEAEQTQKVKIRE